MRRPALPALASLGLACWIGIACAGTRPPGVGRPGVGLADCPSTPNCVSSRATEAERGIDPLELAIPPDEAWPAIHEALSRTKRTRIVTEAEGYLYAECRSALFGFVDDLELELRPDGRTVDVRSASRLGRSDLGVNRARVERLRAALRSRGAVR